MFKTLIVDDEPKIRKGLRTIISWESLGFVIVGEASDGIEALELAEEHKPDLIVTDIKMPRMGGIELSREIKERSSKTELLVLSGYNEFAFAKEAMKYGVIDYLLKPVDPEEMNRVLGKISNRLRQADQASHKMKEKAESLRGFFLGKLARGEIYQNPRTAAAEHDIHLQGDGFCMMIVSIERYGEFLLSLSGRKIGLKRFAVQNVIQELLASRGYCFELNEQLFGILLTAPELLSAELTQQLAERIWDCINRYVKEVVTIGVGTVVTQPEEIKRSYLEAQRALERKFFFDSEHLFMFRREEFDSIEPNIRWDDAGLLQSIREGNREKIKAETEKLLSPRELRFIPLETLKSIVMATIIHLGKLTEEYHGDWQSFYNGKFQQLEHIIGYGANLRLVAFLHAISLEICGYVETFKSRKTDNRIREVVEHIDLHFGDDLNLKELSKMFYVNTVYLGQLFKKETGEYFNDYINKVRVSHARELLEKTDSTATEIAERVGYKYTDHFYRQFKQIYGINPGDIRKQMGRRKE